MATTIDGIELTIEHDGRSYRRTYCKSDARGDVIVLGRASSSTNPDDMEAMNDLDGIGGHVVNRGRAAFVSPVMSRKHARLVFSGDLVYLSDPPNHSHHGTFITRGQDTFRVEHPQPLQNDDRITFGKTVHRAGESYHPLVARVQILRDDVHAQNYLFRSFNGHGYSLPGHFEAPEDDLNDLEDDPDVYKDDEVIQEAERPETHKFYTVHEPDDDDVSSVPSAPLRPFTLPAVRAPPEPITQAPIGQWDREPSSSCQPVQINRTMQWLKSTLNPQPILRPATPPPLPPPAQDMFSPWNSTLRNPFFSASDYLTGLVLPSFPPPLANQGPRHEHAAPEPSGTRQMHRPIEVIDVDEQPDTPDKDEREILSVDSMSAGSSESSDSQSEDECDAEGSSDMDQSDDEVVEVPPPKTTAHPAPAPRLSTDADHKKLLEIHKSVADVALRISSLQSGRDLLREEFELHKHNVDVKFTSVHSDLRDTRGLVAKHNETAAEIQARKKEILEDMEERKQVLMSDMDVYDEDLKYDVDRALDDVDDLVADTKDGRVKVDELSKEIQKLKSDAETAARDYMEALRSVRQNALEEINQAVVGVKRKREEAEAEVDALRVANDALAVPPTAVAHSDVAVPGDDAIVATKEAAVVAAPAIVDVAVQASPSKRLRLDISAITRQAVKVLVGGAALYYGLGVSHTGELLE